ncbi:MAG: hypothetical protein HYU66_21810 [Armatimonadetes bacterium]|nr:hypothetical protein [Armatimonadota bacterium]
MTLAILLAVEFGLARQDWFWNGYGNMAGNAVRLRIDAINEATPGPAIVVMGSSRIRDAVLPEALEARLRLPAGSVYNLAMGGGTPFAGLTIYRAARPKLRQARLLVYGLDDFDVSAGYGVDATDRRYATLAERLRDYDPPQRPSLVTGWFYRTADVQNLLQHFAARLGRPDPRMSFSLLPGRRVREQNDPPIDPRSDVSQMVGEFYRDWAPGFGRLRQLERLAYLARADGLTVMVVSVPLYGGYRRLANERCPEAEPQFRSCLQRLRDDGLPVYDWRDDEALGWPITAFHDSTHVGVDGVPLMTDLLVDAIARSCPALAGTEAAE